MLSRVSLGFLRKEMERAKSPHILCGAGVSMIGPTCLPSGNELRDQCVKLLLSDRLNTTFLRRLLASEGYQRLLPEALLQDISLFASSHLDKAMAKILTHSVANDVHRAIASHFTTIFTTNFDNCFESVGAREVLHLHGSVESPDELQNRIYRLGKGQESITKAFESRIQNRDLWIIGYSIRDEDVIASISRAKPRRIVFLTYDGSIPPVIRSFGIPALVGTGKAEELFGVRALKKRPNRRTTTLEIRQPAIGARCAALLYAVYLSGHYEWAPKILQVYLPKLTGRAKYKSIASVADNLRMAGKYSESVYWCQFSLRSRFCHRPDQADLLCGAHNVLALCELDRGGTSFDLIEQHFSQAIAHLEQFAKRFRSPENEVGIEIFKARIINNMGILFSRRADSQAALRAFSESRQIKLRHHDDRGIAQTESNIAKCFCDMREFDQAEQSLRRVLDIMRKTPDLYVCRDAVLEILPVIARIQGSPITLGQSEMPVALDSELWNTLGNATGRWRGARRRIVEHLNSLNAIVHELSR